MVTCWERADLLALVCGVYCEFHFPIGILGQVWYLIVSIPDLCTLTYFELIPFDCSRMVLLAEVRAKWINFDYLSLTSFDFCKSLIAACWQDIGNNCSPHNRNSFFTDN